MPFLRDSKMKITIESTDVMTSIDGVPVRHWRGMTEDGVPCEVFVHRIAVPDNADSTRFQAELAEKLPPGRFLPLSMIL
jgi:hypothetical protein